jgi:hypothetical protein
MEEEAAIAQCKHDLAAFNFGDRAGRNFDDISRPKGGQHALSVDA